jgi:electron transfer flavoprotein alpha subunit
MSNLSDYKGVWVFAEQREGQLQKVAMELLGKGRALADTLKVELTTVLIGSCVDRLAGELVCHGADRVIYADSPLLERYTTDGCTKVICELAIERKPEIILVGATYLGRDLGPRVAARLSTGLTADCTSLDIDLDTDNLLMTRPAFGGNLMATIVCADHRPQMSTVRPGVFEKLQRDENRQGIIEKINFDIQEEDIRTTIEEVVKVCKDCADIGEAKILVSGGRGLGSQEGFQILGELANALGGTVAGSRAAIENGWIDKSCQVGQTGKTVRPEVYIACGISGAIQHMAGMQDSGFIIAINKDENAPIMQAADLALVGDFRKIVPEMVSRIMSLK